MRKSDIVALVAAGAVLLAPGRAVAHFVLQTPASWAEQDGQGNPQKTAPCGQADPQIAAVPTGAVTPVGAGQAITIVIDEATYHPGHYRVALSTTGPTGLPPDPPTTVPGTCMGLEIEDPPVYPVLADGMLPHTDPLSGPQSFQITLPGDITCANCTLQVLEFMQADVGGSGNCFYHHCATLSIGAAGATDGGADAAAGDGGGNGCSCAVGERRGSLGALFAIAIAAGLRRRRALLAVPLIGLLGGGCGDNRPPEVTSVFSPGDVERTWLQRVGTGSGQTAIACGRGAADPIARALCPPAAPTLGGLTDLYRALALGPDNGGLAAVATHSLGLSARTVTALNARIVVFPRYSPIDPNAIAAAAFSRGEPFVELVGYDPVTGDFNFYLVAFEPACGAGCTHADLLTERLESGWTGWTLYAERDLEDTPLDCTSCHRLDGAKGRLLMRQIDGPWMHWGDFRGVLSATDVCTDPAGVDGSIVADGAEVLRQVDGPEGRHGGVAVANLVVATSGYDLSSFLRYATGWADGTGDIPCIAPECPFSEPNPFPSAGILCDRLRDGDAGRAGGAWDRYRAAVRPGGFPVPHFDPDIVDGALRTMVAADFAAFVAAPPPAGQGGDAFTKLSGLVAPGPARAIGFIPDDTESADVMLQSMCARCHNERTDSRLARSRFNARALDRVDAAGAAEIVRRISLPRTSADRMPPLRAGELSDGAVAQIAGFLKTAPR
jgi:hypothetical protein